MPTVNIHSKGATIDCSSKIYGQWMDLRSNSVRDRLEFTVKCGGSPPCSIAWEIELVLHGRRMHNVTACYCVAFPTTSCLLWKLSQRRRKSSTPSSTKCLLWTFVPCADWWCVSVVKRRHLGETLEQVPRKTKDSLPLIECIWAWMFWIEMKGTDSSLSGRSARRDPCFSYVVCELFLKNISNQHMLPHNTHKINGIFVVYRSSRGSEKTFHSRIKRKLRFMREWKDSEYRKSQNFCPQYIRVFDTQ